MAAYDAYLAGTMEDPEFSQAEMDAAVARLPESPPIREAQLAALDDRRPVRDV
jgi:hypothetical protein